MWLLIGGSGFVGTNFARFLIINLNFSIYLKINMPIFLPFNWDLNTNLPVKIGNTKDILGWGHIHPMFVCYPGVNPASFNISIFKIRSVCALGRFCITLISVSYNKIKVS